MKTNFDGQNMDLEIAVSRKPARKSCKKTRADRPDIEPARNPARQKGAAARELGGRRS